MKKNIERIDQTPEMLLPIIEKRLPPEQTTQTERQIAGLGYPEINTLPLFGVEHGPAKHKGKNNLGIDGHPDNCSSRCSRQRCQEGHKFTVYADSIQVNSGLVAVPATLTT